jgi:HEAT repeat protein
MKGSLENPAIQKVLAQALINDQNTATRLRTVNTIADQSNKKVMADPDVKSALISAAEHDSNPGVRRQAVMTLLELPYDSEIKNCYLNVLTNDPNSAIRMMAINGLAAANLNGHPLDEEILKVLNQKSKNDDNAYVRIRAASLMKEDKIQ